MKRMITITKGTGKVILALFGCVLMPFLIWAAFGAAMNRKLREREAQRETAPIANKTMAEKQVPVREKVQ